MHPGCKSERTVFSWAQKGKRTADTVAVADRTAGFDAAMELNKRLRPSSYPSESAAEQEQDLAPPANFQVRHQLVATALLNLCCDFENKKILTTRC
jgi:hypothetical protein